MRSASGRGSTVAVEDTAFRVWIPMRRQEIQQTLIEWIAAALGVPVVESEVFIVDLATPFVQWRGNAISAVHEDGSVLLTPGDWIAPEFGPLDAVHRVVDVVDSGLRRIACGPGNDAPAPYYSVGVRLGELLDGATDGDAEAAARVLEEWAGAVLEWAQSPDLYDAIGEIRPAIDAMIEPEGPVRLPVDSIRRAIATLQWRIGRLEAFEAAALAHVDELAAALVYLPRGSREWEALGTALDRFAEAIPDRLDPGEVVRDAAADHAEGGGRDRMYGPDAEAVTALLEYLDGDAPEDDLEWAVASLVIAAYDCLRGTVSREPYLPEDCTRLAQRIRRLVEAAAVE